MFLPIILAIVTIFSVVLALKKKRPVFFILPLLSIVGVAFIKILMVPLPLWDTIQFIFDLRG